MQFWFVSSETPVLVLFWLELDRKNTWYEKTEIDVPRYSTKNNKQYLDWCSLGIGRLLYRSFTAHSIQLYIILIDYIRLFIILAYFSLYKINISL